MRLVIRYLCICLLACMATKLYAQERGERILYAEEEDRAIFERYLASMPQDAYLPMDSLMIRSARFFLGTPYVASTLEKEPEGLVINLRELDCTTFAESILALSRTFRGGMVTFEAFCDSLQRIRYREGVIRDYTDRLHYMADWFYENERKGIVQDMTQEIGGIPLTLDLSFISTHPDSYKQLKNQPAWVERMAIIEQAINQRSHYHIPKEEIDTHASRIKTGDILCFVTSIKGLDVTHVGIAYWEAGRLTFIHASSSAKQVIIQPTSLKEYAESIKSCRGIWVARPL